EAEEPAPSLVDPVAVALGCLCRRHEVLHLHLLEFARPEEEVSRCDLVPKGLADLRDAERRLAACELGDVLEVDEDALCGLGPEVDLRPGLLDRPDASLEHQVEVPCLGEVAVGSLTRLLARSLAAMRLLEVG